MTSHYIENELLFGFYLFLPMECVYKTPHFCFTSKIVVNLSKNSWSASNSTSLISLYNISNTPLFFKNYVHASIIPHALKVSLANLTMRLPPHYYSTLILYLDFYINNVILLLREVKMVHKHLISCIDLVYQTYSMQ